MPGLLDYARRMPARIVRDARIVLRNEQIVACNRNAEMLFRCRQDDLLGQSFITFSAQTQPDGQNSATFLRELMAAALTQQRQHILWTCRRLNGDTFAAQAILAPVENQGNLYTEITLREIHSRNGTNGNSQDLQAERIQRVKEWTSELNADVGPTQSSDSELAQVKEVLERRNLILEKLNELTRQITSGLELQPIFDTVLRFIAELIDATSGYVSEIDIEKRTSTVVAEYYGARAAANERVSDLGTSYSLVAEFGNSLESLRERKDSYTLHVDDLDLAPAERQHMQKYGVKSILGIVLFIEDEPVAEIELWESRRKRSFDREEIELLQAIARQVILPIRNARLYKQAKHELQERTLLERRIAQSLERRSRQVRLSTQVTKDIVAATSLSDLYNRVVTQVKEQFNYYYAQLLRYEPSQDALVLGAGSGKAGAKMLASGHRMPMGVGLIGKAAASRQAVLRPDVRKDPDWQANSLLPNTKSELAVPIISGNEVLGVLDVQSEVVSGLDEDDQLVLEGLCGQIAIAIESTNLRQEMADRLQELDYLQRIMSREGWQAFRAQRETAVKGYRFDQRSVKAVADADVLDERKHPVTRFASGKAAVESLGDVITSPMTVRGEIVGELGIQDDPEDPLTDEDRELLESISVQVAEALESARLLEQTHKHAVEMEAVSQVSAAASTILDADKLLQTVTTLTKERFELYHVAILMLEEESLVWVASTALPSITDDEGTLPVLDISDNLSLAARAARDRRPVIVHDVRKETGFLSHPKLTNIRSELAIPLLVGGQVLGVLVLQSNVPNRFGEDDVRIHTTLGAQVAASLQNAYLYAEQLETAKSLRAVDRVKSQFLASMSHELRTPLNSIIGFADVLLEGIDGPLNERMQEDVTLIRNSGRHLRALIGDILDMSKIEAGMMELRYEPIDLSELTKEIMANARTLAMDKDIDIRLNLDSEISYLEADRTRFTQILLNLMSNAIKFTEKGSVTLSVKQKKGEVIVAVKDSGIGIRQEDTATIFEQFRQVDGSLTRQAGGTGLGLPISKRLVELHGGEMRVESKPNVGSTFWFSIPNKVPAKKLPATGPLSRTTATAGEPGD